MLPELILKLIFRKLLVWFSKLLHNQEKVPRLLLTLRVSQPLRLTPRSILPSRRPSSPRLIPKVALDPSLDSFNKSFHLSASLEDQLASSRIRAA